MTAAPEQLLPRRGPGRPSFDSLPLGMRPLRSEERQRAFPGRGHSDLTEYLEAIREMEGGTAYALPVNGMKPRGLRVRMTAAAKQLGLKLRWAKTPPEAAELIVELAE